MEFLCPVVGAAPLGWAHLAHLGLIGVVAIAGLPLTVLAAVQFRRSAATAPTTPADGMSRECEVAVAPVLVVQRPATHRGRSARRSG
jgi:hypothetical protein